MMDIPESFQTKVRAIIAVVLRAYGFDEEPGPGYRTAADISQQLIIQFPQLLKELLGGTMKFSLVNVKSSSGDRVSGNWLHDVIGSFEEAELRAKQFEDVNNGTIDVAVVPHIGSTTPMLNYWSNLKRLDESRKEEKEA
jgi:hypothetical protein